MTNSRLTDPEVLEWRYPVLLESHRINRGSGGKGRHRGGDGTIRRVRFLEPMQAALVSNHRKVPPFGLQGGEPGITGDQWIERADGRREQLAGRCRAEVGAGDVFAVQTPSGGGYGRPLTCSVSPCEMEPRVAESALPIFRSLDEFLHARAASPSARSSSLACCG